MENIGVRCVAYFDPDEGHWCAVALDLDIVTEGDSEEQVVADLNSLIVAQVSFAVYKGDVSLIWRKAPQEYWDIYERLRLQHTLVQLGQTKERVEEGFVSDLPFPDAAVIEQNRASFA